MPEVAITKIRPTPTSPIDHPARCAASYAELDVTTNFSFLRGASHADELVFRAAEMGYRAIAVTDHNTLAGAVRMHMAAKESNLKLLVGARLVFTDTPDVLAWVTNRAAYANLCRLLTLGRRRAEKGECELHLADLLEHDTGLLFAVVPPDGQCHLSGTAADEKWIDSLELLHDAVGERLSLVASCIYDSHDRSRLQTLAQISRATDVPLVATNGVHYHDPSRRALQDVLTCIRHRCTIHDAGFKLFPNGERYLKTPEQMHRLFADHPQAIRRVMEIVEQCTFTLDELRYEYPDEIVPPGQTAISYLEKLAWEGAANRFPPVDRHVPLKRDMPTNVPPKIAELIRHELKLIEKLHYEPYFLTVYDLVKFARSRGILCQGRGSAANSAVCYCIGVTSVDPTKIDLLFERFVSAARNEPPDIDVDFEHERREEVIQYVYEKYGRDRAGMTATVITYRGKSAVRDVGKALGLSLDLVDEMAKKLDWWDRGTLPDDRLREIGLDPNDRTVQLVIQLTTQILGFARHLSQHVGGMVMTRGPLCELVPIENASMENRTVIEWDKDDIDALGILKVDCLALGMLTCISKAFKLLNGETKRRRDEETKWKEQTDGEDQYISGTCSLAEGNESGETDLSSDGIDAQNGAIWVDQPNEASSSIDSVEHRGRLRPPESTGPNQVSPHLARLAERTIDPVRTGPRPGHAQAEQRNFGTDCGSGPRTAGPDPQPRTQTPVINNPHFVSSSLRLSVSPPLELHTIPQDDPAVYDMICDADTVGVFQIESRAQMSMLPRLRPRNFYDLVIEVAIVRPGPIQGDMVHPYLRRRNGEEPVEFPSEALRQVLGKTLGVPLFQEQAMKVAMVAAGFTAEEADQLRRAMAAWRHSGRIEKFQQRMIDGMLANGYTLEFAERCFNQIKGFGEYGFPESHAASFALLVYASAWLKRYHPAAFACALLNSLPMGFYAPAQIVRDARDHGVEVRAVDVNASEWDCTLEEKRRRDGETKRRSEGIQDRATWGVDGPALRLGFRQITGMREAYARAIVAARQRCGKFVSVEHFQQLTGLPVSAIRCLAEADAFHSLDLTRRQALWDVLELKDDDCSLFETSTSSLRLSVSSSLLPPMPLQQEVMRDYATAGLSLKQHPVALLREKLAARKIITAARLQQTNAGKWVSVAGLVLIRQRPGTASGIVFVTLEDETGVANLIIRPDIYERFRPAARHAALLQADGFVERQGKVVHIMAKNLRDLSDWLNGKTPKSRDFH